MTAHIRVNAFYYAGQTVKNSNQVVDRSGFFTTADYPEDKRPGSVMNAISRMSPPQFGHSSGNSSPTLAISLAQAIRDVSWERGF